MLLLLGGKQLPLGVSGGVSPLKAERHKIGLGDFRVGNRHDFHIWVTGALSLIGFKPVAKVVEGVSISY